MGSSETKTSTYFYDGYLQLAKWEEYQSDIKWAIVSKN